MTSNGVPINQPPDPTLAAMDGPRDPFPGLEPFPPPDPVRFPNTRRRISSSANGRTPPDTHASDPDTCRICRGEGSPDEPLFYPCKCSGSIKYVHQDCLMEWLSHSQKKHCELCKTPFRFTKLYDPNMPKALPTGVFVSHTTKYLLRNLLVWMRAGLVVNVWLGWLPYLMRTVWSFLFWISDEGLGGRSAAAAGNWFGVVSGYGSSVCPASPLFAATTTASTARVIENLPPESARLVKGLYGFNLTSSDPIYSTILRLLFGPVAASEPAVNTTARLAAPARESLLSGVAFLRNLTRHSSVNRAVIDILEGQIITILVIVCFILIILVRDYVVQQQPEINMRAAFAAENQAAPVEPAHEAAEAEAELQEAFEVDDSDSLDDTASEIAQPPSLPQRPDSPGESSTQRLPDLSPPPMDNPRDMREFDRATVHEYLAVYREAGGDPEEILRIARERNLEGRLDYWVRLTRSMMDRQRESESAEASDGPSGKSILEEWDTDADRLDDVALERGPSDSKGKARLVEDVEESIEEALSSPIGRLRPRANTDGPPVNNAVNPLANNSWSFADLPPSDPNPDEHYPAWEPPSPPSSGPDRPPSPAAPQDAAQPLHDVPDRSHTQPPPPPRNPTDLTGRLADFMWREVDRIDDAELAPVTRLGDFGEDEPDENDPINPVPNPDRDREVVDAAAAAGLDAEAVEDAEDLEGVLELLGMRGPVAGLFQNAIFCAFLVSITIFLGIFIPYNIGRVTIWGLANPMRIARMLFGFSKFVQDCALLAAGLASTTISQSVYLVSRPLMLNWVADYSLSAVKTSWSTAVGAAHRIAGSFVSELPLVSASEVRNFSAISHEALFVVKDRIALGFAAAWQAVTFVFGGHYALKSSLVLDAATKTTALAWHALQTLPSTVLNPSSWVLDLNLPEAAVTVSAELAYWGGMDRFWAILAGYVAVSLMAGLYLRRGAPFSSTQAAQDWEASIIDGLNQASGVMKVILIISIEMLVFPLYCGMLLDVALLPLFENATLKSRLLFTLNYPVTSIFVHWFIGTGYMFHFALFVSMCRKIMRKGVLYFIRDPDDPEFHPVRDVLERNVTTQLRKILFSAFVYGALVIVCLGGVVWGLYLSLPNVLPVHYSSNEPVLEFPIDLLFYNFIMPFAVRFFKPTHGLHAMYTWWFRRCARALRITWFLFGEWRVDEEGRLALKAESPDRRLPFWRRWFLEVNPDGEVVARSWRGIFEGGTSRRGSVPSDHALLYDMTKKHLVRTGQLVPDGRFVRTPASDQVKIPKGSTVFLEVNEDNTRRDGMSDRSAGDIYSTNQYQLVYVPPYFRVRIFLFILFIWLFAAVTGVGITIVPLVFGRWMFRQLIPGHIRTNDVYAFSIGIHILGTAAYALYHARSIYGAIKTRSVAAFASVFGHDGPARVRNSVARVAGVVYAYLFAFGLLPLLVASLMELYALMPLHELMYNAVLRGSKATKASPAHTVRLVQAWTIGLLYLKLAMRITNTWFRGSRVSNAARAVLRRGWLDPDVSILTRSFVVPALAIWLAAVVTPLLLAKLTIADGLAEAAVAQELAKGTAPAYGDAYRVLIYRMSFPLMALGIAGGFALWSVVGVFRSWQVRIRDEAYLIGERLHNFGGANNPRPRGAWRTGRV